MDPDSDCCWHGNSSGSNSSSADTIEAAHISVELPFNVVACIMSVFSLIGASTIISLYLYIPKLRTPSRKLLIYLSVCDLMVAVGNITGVVINVYAEDADDVTDFYSETLWEYLCVIQAAISSCFSIGSFFWTTVIAVNIYLVIVKNSHILVTRLGWLTHSLCWGVPLVVLGVTLSANRYGYNDSIREVWWCWVRVDKGEMYPDHLMPLFWQLLTGKFWEISSYIIVVVLYSLVRYRIRQHMRSLALRRSSESAGASATSSDTHTCDTSQILQRAHRKLLAVPFMFILARIWGTARFLITLSPSAGAQNVGLIIATFQGAGDSSQGFLNCLVFVLTTQEVKSMLIKRRWCLWGKRSKSPAAFRLSVAILVISVVRIKSSRIESESETRLDDLTDWLHYRK